ncbi:hypothetical protein QVD17_11200 [Tagetes erecta]|uniref:Uncharacterized protein n=1 Tax=Tagetes erecta TaxID=13708 RepID=A0AAD8P1X3_TARER|nr:hypothetical protein QVD17_11200 [Tagetes erecta]
MKRGRVGGEINPSSASVNDDDQERVLEPANNKKTKKKMISLSDFLQRKQLPPHKSLQAKDTPFLSPGTTSAAATTHHKTNQLHSLDTLLQHFNHNNNHQHSTTLTHIQDHFPGKPFAPKGVVILGGDPMPKQAKYPNSFITKEKPPPPVYNHYASGSGWWDSDMEGIDNDEVGFNEVWEGVGSATIGGLDWH